MKLEDVLAPKTIRSWKDMPMQRFDNIVWETLGRKYARKENQQWVSMTLKASLCLN
ncbi:hypothetical protein C1H46_022966 [Malus baccata]|uniref:RDRP helical domain-containing protein n=1 Tax=Malus baccata TaxID=106549 RepID=A0A540LY96_MALBA|nr:hypothetical protein C1H46_022966 [Malus baccata]